MNDLRVMTIFENIKSTGPQWIDNIGMLKLTLYSNASCTLP